MEARSGVTGTFHKAPQSLPVTFGLDNSTLTCKIVTVTLYTWVMELDISVKPSRVDS